MKFKQSVLNERPTAKLVKTSRSASHFETFVVMDGDESLSVWDVHSSAGAAWRSAHYALVRMKLSGPQRSVEA